MQDTQTVRSRTISEYQLTNKVITNAIKVGTPKKMVMATRYTLLFVNVFSEMKKFGINSLS